MLENDHMSIEMSHIVRERDHGHHLEGFFSQICTPWVVSERVLSALVVGPEVVLIRRSPDVFLGAFQAGPGRAVAAVGDHPKGKQRPRGEGGFRLPLAECVDDVHEALHADRIDRIPGIAIDLEMRSDDAALCDL